MILKTQITWLATLLVAFFFILGCDNNSSNNNSNKTAFLSIPTENLVTVTARLTFGTADRGCSGRGICSKRLNGTDCGEKLPITLYYDSRDTTKIYIEFDLHEDTMRQPGQSFYWRTGAPAFAFDVPYSVSKDNPELATNPKWTLCSGTIIAAEDPLEIINYDSATHIITLKVGLKHSNAVNGWVIFGGKNSSGAFSDDSLGIYQFQSDSFGPVGNSAAVWANLRLSNDDASLLIMSVCASRLKKAQRHQYDSILSSAQKLKSYKDFGIEDPIFNPLMLPRSTAIFPRTQISVADSVDSIFIATLYDTRLDLGHCDSASNIVISTMTSGFTASWDISPNTVATNIVYRQGIGGGEYGPRMNLKYKRGNQETITGLVPATPYELYLITVCNGGITGKEVKKTFSTEK